MRTTGGKMEMMRRWAVIFGALLLVLLVQVVWPGQARADDANDLWPPMPGIAIHSGGGWYRSVPCGCVDRGLFNVDLTARLHFGRAVTMEAQMQRGVMLLGGRFPSSGWAAGASAAVLPQRGRWWDRLSLRGGYRQWSVMGMRAPGTRGFYAGLNWAVPVMSHLFIEAEVRTGRTFGDMPHWPMEGRLGVSTRF